MPSFELTEDEITLVREINDKYRVADEGAHKDFREKADRYYSLYRGVREWGQRVDGVDRRDRDVAYREGKDRWGAELFIPYAFRTVETVVPRMLAHRPRMLLTPWDEQALGNVNNMRMLLDRQQEQFDYELVVQDVAKDMIAISREGLKRRARMDGSFIDETTYLGELEAIADSGLTPAERLLEKFHGEWQGDISRVFEECAY